MQSLLDWQGAEQAMRIVHWLRLQQWDWHSLDAEQGSSLYLKRVDFFV